MTTSKLFNTSQKKKKNFSLFVAPVLPDLKTSLFQDNGGKKDTVNTAG